MSSASTVESDVKTVNKVSYSIKEATQITGLGRTTLWQAVEDGRLRCFKVGRRVLFSLEHLQEFLKSYEVNGDQPHRLRPIGGRGGHQY